jgi:hypothetical protein
MKTTFFRDTLKFLQKDISLSLSLSYIAMIAIGMIFNTLFYRCFHLNIIEYSDISDFLLAPFRDPFILVFTIGTCIFIYLAMQYDEWVEQKYPTFYKWMHFGMSVKFIREWYHSKNGTIMIALIYIFIAADIYGKLKYKSILNGENNHIHITLKDNKLEAIDTLLFIGKTNGYIFIFNKNKKSTLVVPMNDVLRVELMKK